VRQFSALAQASSTLYSLDAIAKGTSLERVQAKALKNMLETSSMMMHHDTITGTSPERVIKAAVNRAKVHEIANSLVLADSMMSRVMNEVELEGLTQCIQEPNDKYDCLIDENELDHSPRAFVVYNPSVKAR